MLVVLSLGLFFSSLIWDLAYLVTGNRMWGQFAFWSVASRQSIGLGHKPVLHLGRRLRLKGLIERIPHTHRYVATPAGRRIAIFFSKTYARVLRPGLTRLDRPPPPDAPDQLAAAWHRFDQALDHFVGEARLAA